MHRISLPTCARCARARGLTLTELALKMGRSVGWISQVERGISRPAIGDLRAFATVFGVPVSLFFTHEAADEAERGVIVRADRRRSLGTAETGLVEELLSPDLGGSFEILRSEFAPGAALAEPGGTRHRRSRLRHVRPFRHRDRRRLA
jgi:transcriptional regulator with XRE-family HTH domain